MEKLKKKIFLVIFSILTIFLLSVLCIFNYQDYHHEKNVIEDNLMRVRNDKSRIGQFKPEELERKEETGQRPVFMDVIAYTVIYNDAYEVTDIINYTQNDISDDEIKKVAEEILEEDNKETTKVGNLYFDHYSYSFKGDSSLTIIDNTTARTKLVSLLKTSIAVFILLEIVIILVSLKLTTWIIKPVVESFERQKQFIADASHELKTPISVIMANAEALEREPEEIKWLSNIKSESERMNELVSDLLDLAKLENKTNQDNYQEESLSKIVERSLLTFESLIYENKIKLTYDIEKNININCNINQIKQLIAILLDNAIHHSVENGEIRVILKKEKSEIVLKVTNKGKEIPKEMQEKIFERFYRADESRNRDNNRYGLGLAIAKNIVIHHNGKIAVQSANGYTTFIVRMKQV